MHRIIFGLAAAASLAATAMAPAAAQYAPPGSYQQSCTNIRVRDGELTARCTNPQGQRVRSMIALSSCRGGDIANSNGQLVCNGGSTNRWRHRDHGYGNNGYNNGNGNGNGYGNNGYGNGNGNGYGNGYAPGGSYQQSCNNIRMSGGTLTASCPGPNGAWLTTSINPRACNGADIANRNGRLSCG